ncbi:MAG: hypothetical protein FJ318_10100 [SAR202 cluster bacterium]|nr:hypothetical protein [SAR202 cluster bacterium]
MADARERQTRAAHVDALLALPAWAASWPLAEREGRPAAPTVEGPADEAAGAARYRLAAERIHQEIEDDVAERAIATGLIVGVAPSAALELQLHVLSRLGKRPTLGTWMEMLKRAGASIFVNTYLQRGDTLAISLAINKIAMGLNATAELGEEAAAYLRDLDAAEDVDADDDQDLASTMGEAMEGAEDTGIPLLKPLATMGAMSFTVGSIGLRQIADVVDAMGNELLQGAIADGILYHHGMALAADTLALDQAHRESAAMHRGARQGTARAASVAGRILQSHIRDYRAAYRQRRRVVTGIPGLAVKQVERLSPFRRRRGEAKGDVAPEAPRPPAPGDRRWRIGWPRGKPSDAGQEGGPPLPPPQA